ncbi:CbiX/SirB N-terminal domain-containing protein [Rhodovibrionaceae bacterium A322]
MVPLAPKDGPGLGHKAALLVAHGSPSHPEGPEEQLQDLTRKVQTRLEDWHLESATLAAPESLEQALARFGPTEEVLIYPLFISDGWFVSRELPRRLRSWQDSTPLPAAQAVLPQLTLLQPLGLEPALPALCLRRAEQAARAQNWILEECRLIIAAHGSSRDRRPGAQIEQLARHLDQQGRFKEVCHGFLDQTPRLTELDYRQPHSLALVFFTGGASHVRKDLPEIFSAGGFSGPVVGPLGEDPAIASVLAASLRHQAEENAIWGRSL